MIMLYVICYVISMELKQYLKIIAKNFKLIFIVAILIALVVAIVSVKTPAKYNVSLSLLISRIGREQTSDYRYDGYYAIKAADEFSKNVTYWFKSPEVVRAIYQRAELESSYQSIRSLAKAFRAQQLAPQFVEVRFSTPSEADAKKIASAIPEVLQEKANRINTTSWQSIAFSIMGEEPVIIFKKPEVLLNTLLGFLAGLILGVFVVSAKEYLKS